MRTIWKKDSPAATRRWANAGLMLVRRLRRWPNIEPTSAHRLVAAGSKLPLGLPQKYLQ